MKTQHDPKVVPLNTGNWEQPVKRIITEPDYENILTEHVEHNTFSFPTKSETSDELSDVYDEAIESSRITGEKQALSIKSDIVETYVHLTGVDDETPSPTDEPARFPEEHFRALISS